MSTHCIELAPINKHIQLLTLNRPEVLNALNRKLLEELSEVLDGLAADKNLRALIITGAGDRAFSAGADLKDRQGMTKDASLDSVRLISQTFSKLAAFPKPTLAAINGVAFGGGLELALACDLRIMHEHAQVGLTECSLGILPGAGGTQRLPRLVGLAKAKEMIWLAKRVCAREALEMGLVSHVTQGNPVDKAFEIADGIAQNAPLSIVWSKKAIDDGFELSLEQGVLLEQNCYEQIATTKDRLEGLAAFSEKRKPKYLGE